MSRALVLMVGAALVAAGCARYVAKPLAADAVAATLESRTLTDAGLRMFLDAHLPESIRSWPLASWEFPSLTLAAFYFHPDLDVARARWATAQAGRIGAGERPNPALSLSPGRDTTTLIPSPWLVTTVLDIPVETAGKRGYRIARADHLSEAARLNVMVVAWQVRSAVRRSLLELYAGDASVRLLSEQQAIHAEIVSGLEAQLGAGAISVLAVTQARIALDNIQLALRDAERQYGEARAQLAAALGLPMSALDGTKISFAEFVQAPPPLPPADVRRQALLNRADVLSALAEYAASEADLHLEIAKQFPDVHFNPGYEYDQGDNKWSLGLSVTLPVLNQNQGAIAVAEARRNQAAAEFTALQARVIADLNRTVAAYGAAVAKTATADALLVKARQQAHTATALLEAGEASRLDLLSAQIELGHNALAQLDALVKAQQAFGQLEDAMQSPVGLSESLWSLSPRSAVTPEGAMHD